MLRAAVAAKTPLGVKAKEAMNKVRSFCIESQLRHLPREIANMILCYNFAGRTCFWWLGCWHYRWSNEKTFMSERFHSWWFSKNCGPSTEGMTLFLTSESLSVFFVCLKYWARPYIKTELLDYMHCFTCCSSFESVFSLFAAWWDAAKPRS